MVVVHVAHLLVVLEAVALAVHLSIVPVKGQEAKDNVVPLLAALEAVALAVHLSIVVEAAVYAVPLLVAQGIKI